MPKGRKSEFYVKYAVIGRNIYSYLLYKMLGKNCIVISNKQPIYYFSFDNLIIEPILLQLEALIEREINIF